MMERDPIMQYKMDAINTLSEDELGLMLFEAARRHARQCQEAIARQDWTMTVQHGRFVQDVMANLVDSLNDDHPQADMMRQLYLYCWRQSIQAQMGHRAEDLDSVIEILGHFIEGIKGHLALKTRPKVSPDTVASVNFAG